MSEQVERYIETHAKWASGMNRIRAYLHTTPLSETVKWGMPTYTINGKNVVGIGAFKNHFGVWFFKGALINDSGGHLRNAQKGKTQAMRQLVFSDNKDVNISILKELVEQAIQNEKAGKQVSIQPKKAVAMPQLLMAFLENHPKINAQFESLTPSKQNEYKSFIAEAKRESTKLRRLEKIKPLIEQGQGLNDKYR